MLYDWLKSLGHEGQPDKKNKSEYSEMLHLDFKCAVGDGMGQYSLLGFPSRNEYANLPEGWADEMQPGSLNANIEEFPADFDELADGQGYDVQKLDDSGFKPAAIIPAELIENNALQPRPSNPKRGQAQIWPCEVSVIGTSKTFNAWAVRRNGSAYTDVIEIMSDQHLRKTYGIKNGDRLNVRLFAPRT